VESGYADYGSVVLSLSSNGLDSSGVPDLVNVSRAYNSDITGTMQEDSPARTSRTLHGHLFRAANSSLGNIWFTTSGIGFTNIVSVKGSAFYAAGAAGLSWRDEGPE
jgi:hypothetical protein